MTRTGGRHRLRGGATAPGLPPSISPAIAVPQQPMLEAMCVKLRLLTPLAPCCCCLHRWILNGSMQKHSLRSCKEQQSHCSHQAPCHTSTAGRRHLHHLQYLHYIKQLQCAACRTHVSKSKPAITTVFSNTSNKNININTDSAFTT